MKLEFLVNRVIVYENVAPSGFNPLWSQFTVLFSSKEVDAICQFLTEDQIDDLFWHFEDMKIGS